MEQIMVDQDVQEVNIAELSEEGLEKALSDEPVEEAETEVKEKAELETKEEKPEIYSKEDYDSVVSEGEKLKDRVANQEKMIARFGTEVGLLRKKSPEEERVEVERIRDIFLDDPDKGQEALNDYNKRKSDAEKLEKDTLFQQQMIETKNTVIKYIPDFENALDDMAEVLKADNVPADVIEGFKKNPYVLDHTTLYALNKRAHLVKENTDFKTEIEKLKEENKKLKAKPGELARNIEAASKQKPITAKPEGADVIEDLYSGKIPSQMTKEELDKAMEG